ncbi:NAD-dependent epimerase/dehydratase family protein [Defluviimonas sp. SAOS-178_SWC]|uniref:NAD-dependent epimerase/dehydratase family protein n=1 Tax=Defluviimonas sp. SAOS-178_SWC TaxID=3121287 RepID=UPI00322146D4
MIADHKIGPVLITGSEGFLGRALTDRLTSEGETVVALDLLPAADRAVRPRPDQVMAVTGDITDPEVLTKVVAAHGVKAIVNLAALIIPACRANPILGAQVNILGHINAFEAARRNGVGRVVYTSTIAAKPRGPYASPVNLYGVYKHCCEEIAKIYHLDHGIASVGLRPNVVYGPGRTVGETAFVSEVIAAAVRGEAFDMPFSGRMCLQHVDEVVDVIVRSLRSQPDGPVVSDITTDTVSMDDLIETVRTVVPGARITASDTPRPAPDNLDNTRLVALLGAWPAVSLEEGVRRTAAALS